MVPIVSKSNSMNIVSDSNDDLYEEDFKNIKDKVFDEDVNDQFKISPQTTINAKVVPALKKLKALYKNNANKIIK